MTAQEKLRTEISAFLKATGMLPTQFGRLAVGDKTLMSRIKSGSGVSFETAEKLRKFMAEYKKQARPKARPRMRADRPAANG